MALRTAAGYIPHFKYSFEKRITDLCFGMFYRNDWDFNGTSMGGRSSSNG